MSTNESTWRQAFDLLCDERIGYGMSRQVFTSKLLPDCVIKIEDTAGQFQNVVEWETWNRVKGTDASRWFAECRWISSNGAILIMERTRPASPPSTRTSSRCTCVTSSAQTTEWLAARSGTALRARNGSSATTMERTFCSRTA